ncbi:MAG: DUF3662 and FHA domain-containing protein [Acidimicrobiia bacterium]
MGLQSIERRLERLVEGTFSKAFRSGLQPVEIGRRMVRELDARRTLGVRGTVVPNHIEIFLSPSDFDRFEPFGDVLAKELAESARAHAHEEGCTFLGPVTVELVCDDEMHRGGLDIEAGIHEGPGGRTGSLVLPGGQRVALSDHPVIIGRLAECDVTLDDPRVSRRHAEIRPLEGGYCVVDLGSLNGTTVNGVGIRDHVLADSDVINIGTHTIRFEAS